MQLKKFHQTCIYIYYYTAAAANAVAVNRTRIPTKLVKFRCDRRPRVRLINNNTIGARSGGVGRFETFLFAPLPMRTSIKQLF